MSKFKIEYDDDLDETIQKVSKALVEYGLTIEYDEDEESSGDGIQSYEIIKISEY